MSIWKKLFGRRMRCAKCGKSLSEKASLVDEHPGLDPFSSAVQNVSGVISTPGETCEQCGAVMCTGCSSMDGSFECPKCGSKEAKDDDW